MVCNVNQSIESIIVEHNMPIKNITYLKKHYLNKTV